MTLPSRFPGWLAAIAVGLLYWNGARAAADGAVGLIRSAPAARLGCVRRGGWEVSWPG